jgi:hypothetical protein
LHYTKDSAHCQTRFNYILPAPPSQTDLDNIASGIGNLRVGYLVPRMPGDCYLTNVTVTDLTTATGAQSVFTFPPNTQGGLPGVACPSNVALAISNRTALRGRSYRGRNYVPGGSSFTTTQSAVSGAYANAWLATLAVVDSIVTGVGGWPVIISRFTGGMPRPVAIITALVYRGLVNYVTDSQRRRLPGRGQ